LCCPSLSAYFIIDLENVLDLGVSLCVVGNGYGRLLAERKNKLSSHYEKLFIEIGYGDVILLVF
jgi:hypothetical protein